MIEAEVHSPRRLGDRADVAVCAAIVLVMVVAALLRQDFNGDGLRHLPLVFRTQPILDTARSLLFPAALFAAIHPLVAAGWVHTVEQAIQPFLWLIVLSGVAYLLALRQWLKADGHRPAVRAGALALAGMSSPFLFQYTNVTEPQIPAALVISALALARTYARRPDRAAPALVIAAVLIVVAALFYQALIAAVGLLPLVVARDARVTTRTLAAVVLTIALAPIVQVGVRVASGVSMGTSVANALLGEENPLIRSRMAIASAMKYAAAVVAGPPQAIVGVDQFHGIPRLVADLRGGDSMAVANLLRLGVGELLFVVMAVAVIRHRDWRLAVAMLAIMALPAIRNQQYAYPKFYVLWPALIAIAATRFHPRTICAAAVAVTVLNVSLLAQDLGRGRTLSAQVRTAYAVADSRTCWLTSGWDPPLWYLWPGTATPFYGMFSRGPDPALQAREMTAALQRCFCDASGVWTDTDVESSVLVDSIARQFEYRDGQLSSTVWRPGDGSTEAGAALTIHHYAPAAAAAICAQVRSWGR